MGSERERIKLLVAGRRAWHGVANHLRFPVTLLQEERAESGGGHLRGTFLGGLVIGGEWEMFKILQRGHRGDIKVEN